MMVCTDCTLYDMIWYDIYLLQLGFQPVAVVGNLYKIGRRQHKRETIHKTIKEQYKNTEYTK